MNIEVWKPVVGFEGLYYVSNRGRIKNKKGRIMKTFISRGYERVALLADQKRCVHRMVAETFIPNPLNLPCVNHKDENKLNNNVENLEWVNHKTNNNYGTRGKRIGEKLKKPIIVFYNGVFFDQYESQRQAAESLKISTTTVSQGLHGKQINKFGYTFKRA